MEVATDEANTPIKQDTKKGKLRDYPCVPTRETLSQAMVATATWRARR
jgi:hypothetical protein